MAGGKGSNAKKSIDQSPKKAKRSMSKNESSTSKKWTSIAYVAAALIVVLISIYAFQGYRENAEKTTSPINYGKPTATAKPGKTSTKSKNLTEAECNESNNFCGKVAVDKKIKIARGSNPEGKPPDVSLAECKDRHPECKAFKRNGECKKNPGWMTVNCAASCLHCHLLDPAIRCNRTSLGVKLEPAYKPNDMNAMFEGLVEKYQSKYGVTVVSTSPWIVTFDNFISDDEVEALIATNLNTLERSTDTGSMNAYGETGRILSQGRTSSNSWCRDKCEAHPAVQRLTRRIEEVTGIEKTNYENFQVLQYELGQAYNAHHDMSPLDSGLACGPRVLTFFLYLSDVEEGGETAFPSLGIAVKPAKGKALLWPSTLNDDPSMQDIRTIHEARPVVKGVKYAANAWLHLYDYRVANLWGCTGTFD